MTLSAFFDRIMPHVGALPDRERALALAMAMDMVRGGEPNEVMADVLVEEIRQRFLAPRN